MFLWKSPPQTLVPPFTPPPNLWKTLWMSTSRFRGRKPLCRKGLRHLSTPCGNRAGAPLCPPHDWLCQNRGYVDQRGIQGAMRCQVTFVTAYERAYGVTVTKVTRCVGRSNICSIPTPELLPLPHPSPIHTYVLWLSRKLSTGLHLVSLSVPWTLFGGRPPANGERQTLSSQPRKLSTGLTLVSLRLPW